MPLRKPRMLRSSSYAYNDITIHEDLLSSMPSAISKLREGKPFTPNSTEKRAQRTSSNTCIMCHEENKPNGSRHEVAISGVVKKFANDFPYLPFHHQLYYLCPDDDAALRAIHESDINEFGFMELYWLLKACRDDAISPRPDHTTIDRRRHVAGFNLGVLAGQSQDHIHLQSGWEVVLEPREIAAQELALFLYELKKEGLVIYEDDEVAFVAPWTPWGPYSVDLIYKKSHELTDLSDLQLHRLAEVGEQIVRIYTDEIARDATKNGEDWGLQNVNIVMQGAPSGFDTEPLIFHFVPRTNATAMYEILGVNVVDTMPTTTHTIFSRGSRRWEDSFKSELTNQEIAITEEQFAARAMLLNNNTDKKSRIDAAQKQEANQSN